MKVEQAAKRDVSKADAHRCVLTASKSNPLYKFLEGRFCL